jgi:hypothetical protein
MNKIELSDCTCGKKALSCEHDKRRLEDGILKGACPHCKLFNEMVFHEFPPSCDRLNGKKGYFTVPEPCPTCGWEDIRFILKTTDGRYIV